MMKSDNSSNGSQDTTVIVVDFQNKTPIAVFVNESDKVILNYLTKMGMAPKKRDVRNDLIGDNILLFSKVA